MESLFIDKKMAESILKTKSYDRLDVLKDTGYIKQSRYNGLYNKGEEHLKMLVATIKTSKEKKEY